MAIITPNIDPGSGKHIYLQIYEYIKNEIKSGNLTCRTKMPSTRMLSGHLQVSRNTVEMAYGQLMDEGYIESEPKRGYFVCDIANHIPAIRDWKRDEAQDFYSADRKQSGEQKEAQALDSMHFSPYGIDLEHFPYSTWRKVMKDVLYDERNTTLFQAGHSQGDVDFRQAIAAYLHQSRGVRCRPDQIIVGAGNDYLLLLLSQLLEPSANIAIEDPSYLRAYKILSLQKFTMSMIPLDRYGMDIERLRRSHANIAYVTPSHQFPMGIVMPVKRRMELLSWANEVENRYIVEDDYDSEFRYKGKPIPSLQGFDSQGKVIYLGTFSKAIAPSMRVGYIVLPEKLMDVYQEKYSFYSNTVARTEQRQLTEFINRGHFERHLNRMRNIYKTKRDLIIRELEPYKRKIRITGENSGLHLLIQFKDGRDEEMIIKQAEKLGLHLYGLSSFYVTNMPVDYKATILLGYANLSEHQLLENLNLLKQIL